MVVDLAGFSLDPTNGRKMERQRQKDGKPTEIEYKNGKATGNLYLFSLSLFFISSSLSLLFSTPKKTLKS
jgi:hypothetical protein